MKQEPNNITINYMENKHTQYVDFSNPNADKITTGVTNKPMINKKQTAVEWLVEQVNSDCLNSAFIRPDLIKEAKEMEKQQKMNDYAKGKVNYNSVLNGIGKNISPEEFYEQEYGGENK